MPPFLRTARALELETKRIRTIHAKLDTTGNVTHEDRKPWPQN